jgi:hypothetical protein
MEECNDISGSITIRSLQISVEAMIETSIKSKDSVYSVVDTVAKRVSFYP